MSLTKVIAAVAIFVAAGLALSAQEISRIRYGGSYEPCPQGNSIEPWCRAGESVIGVAVNVPKAVGADIDTPPCALSDEKLLSDFMNRVGAGKDDQVAEISRAGSRNVSSCGVLAVRIPDKTEVTRIQTTVSANNHPGRCGLFDISKDQLISTRCGADPGHPESAATHAIFSAPRVRTQWVGVVFRNWSHDQMRTPFLRVYYRPAPK